MLRLIVALSLVTCILSSTLTIRIDSHKEECFFDEVTAVGQKVFFAYQVTQGGALDIDAIISGPGSSSSNILDADDPVIYEQERETDGRVLFKAHETGVHKFCLSNKMSTLTTKTVMFQIVVGDPMDSPKKKTTVTATVDRSMMRLEEVLSMIRTQQSHLRARERVHRATAETTNERVLWGSIIQSSAMVASQPYHCTP